MKAVYLIRWNYYPGSFAVIGVYEAEEDAKAFIAKLPAFHHCDYQITMWPVTPAGQVSPEDGHH